MGHVENETARSEIPGACVTSALAAHWRMNKGVAEEERMQHGNYAACLLQRHSFGSKSSVASRVWGTHLQQTRAEFGYAGCLVVHPSANSTKFQATGHLRFLH